MPNDHFVPRHYLRQFAVSGSEMIVVTSISPYRFLGPKGIGGQCCEDDFYENNSALNKLLGVSENDIAPVLVRVTKKQDFDTNEINALKMLAVILRSRTRKAAETAKVLPKYLANKLIKSGIERGELPPPPDEKLTEDMWDFAGVSGLLISQSVPCWMEMQTLECKLLQADSGSYFITSDNPIAALNQFCGIENPNRPFVGFSRSGFQLVLPISPNLCLFFYDAKIYKVGNRKDRLVKISKQDVEIINALQVQSAEERLYFHDTIMGPKVGSLVARYDSLRMPIRDHLAVIPSKQENKEFLHLKGQSVKLPLPWSFCRHRRHLNFQPGDRRDPAWTALADRLIQDIEQNPTGGDVFMRLKKLLA